MRKEEEEEGRKKGRKEEKDKENDFTTRFIGILDQFFAEEKTDFEIMADLLALIVEEYEKLFNYLIGFLTGSKDKEKEKDKDKEKEKENKEPEKEKISWTRIQTSER